MLKKLVAGALFAGVVAGLVSVVLQFLFVQPLLLEAELFESGARTHFGDASTGTHPDGGQNGGIDLRRDGMSVLFSIFLYAGYGLMLIAGMALATMQGVRIPARHGLIWGIAGFVAVQLAPAFGIAPELPGSAAADIAERQVWWLVTVAATALALWLIAFHRGLALWGLAVVLLLGPHLVGAPQPDGFAGPVPPELSAAFAARALAVGMAAWSVLGLVAAQIWSEGTQNA